MGAKAVIEAETDEEHIETRSRVKPATAQRLEISYELAFDRPPGPDETYSVGSRHYERVDGVWYEIRRRRNPAYWDKPNFFLIAPGPGNLAFIVCKAPRRIQAAVWRQAVYAIFKDATGMSWYAHRKAGGGGPVIDGTEEDIYDRRVAREKPEPAYEIFIDGTWKRTDQADSYRLGTQPKSAS